MYSRWRRQRATKKITPGDDHSLKPFRAWHLLSRSVFYVQLDCDDHGERCCYAVDVPHFDWEDQAKLYLNGKHAATSSLPAAFPVAGGVIEVAASTFGLKRMHYTPASGGSWQLTPDPGSAEGLRARFDSHAPRLSRAVGLLSLVFLIVALVLGVPQLLEVVTSFEAIAERIGTVTSPIQLPAQVNTVLGVGAVAASVERGLRLRYNWLLDGDITDWE